MLRDQRDKGATTAILPPQLPSIEDDEYPFHASFCVCLSVFVSPHQCLCLHARASVCGWICLSLCAYTSCLVLVGLCLLLSINGLSQELARQSRLGWANATLISDQIQKRTSWREDGELVGWGNWFHTCRLCSPLKPRTVYYFVVPRDLSRGAGNEENGLAGSCGMGCLARGLRLLLYWLPSQLTHPTLLILY